MKFITPDWPAPENIKAFTTTRLGWKTTTPFVADQLKGSDDSKQLQDLLQLPSEPVWLKQTHGIHAVEATPDNIGHTADASFASKPRQVCLVQTADCLPILICHRDGTHVAAIHGGWRGLAAGIIENTIKSLGKPGDELMAWLGPAISADVFEVGEDVVDAFTRHDVNASAAFKPYKEGKWLGNLYQLAAMRLQQQGVNAIYGGDFCTYRQHDWFYSYRRDKGLTGRMASVIWIDSSH